MNEDTKTPCPYCGTLVDKTEEVCPQCYAPLKQTQNTPEPSEGVEGPTKPAKQQAKLLAPTAVASLVLGILSINFSSLIIPGFILAAIGKRKANEGFDAIAANPDTYTGAGMLNAGRITSKVGLILSIVMIPIWIFYIAIYAIALSEGF
ncbi:MAG: hypothetical protein II829_00395 [Bacteroidales bacterium]|jgi:hypothetical protein|nr:hypothetical protein [Bacteroidales bacterium]